MDDIKSLRAARVRIADLDAALTSLANDFESSLANALMLACDLEIAHDVLRALVAHMTDKSPTRRDDFANTLYDMAVAALGGRTRDAMSEDAP